MILILLQLKRVIYAMINLSLNKKVIYVTINLITVKKLMFTVINIICIKINSSYLFLQLIFLDKIPNEMKRGVLDFICRSMFSLNILYVSPVITMEICFHCSIGDADKIFIGNMFMLCNLFAPFVLQ